MCKDTKNLFIFYGNSQENLRPHVFALAIKIFKGQNRRISLLIDLSVYS